MMSITIPGRRYKFCNCGLNRVPRHAKARPCSECQTRVKYYKIFKPGDDNNQ